MNKNIFIPLFLILSTLISCTQHIEEEITPITETVILNSCSVFNIQDRSYSDMMIVDSLLVMIANKDTNYFHLFNKTTMVTIQPNFLLI